MVFISQAHGDAFDWMIYLIAVKYILFIVEIL